MRNICTEEFIKARFVKTFCSNSNLTPSHTIRHGRVIKIPMFFKSVLCKVTTVRRTNKKWSGIWTDLLIEQILMKSLKGRSGVVSKGISTNVMRVWTHTMHRCAEVTDAVSSILLTEKCQEQHKEIFAARVNRDYEDFQVIQSWFNNHNSFTAGNSKILLL